MSEQKIILPSKPRAVLEESNKGVFEIDAEVPLIVAFAHAESPGGTPSTYDTFAL